MEQQCDVVNILSRGNIWIFGILKEYDAPIFADALFQDHVKSLLLSYVEFSRKPYWDITRLDEYSLDNIINVKLVISDLQTFIELTKVLEHQTTDSSKLILARSRVEFVQQELLKDLRYGLNQTGGAKRSSRIRKTGISKKENRRVARSTTSNEKSSRTYDLSASSPKENNSKGKTNNQSTASKPVDTLNDNSKSRSEIPFGKPEVTPNKKRGNAGSDINPVKKMGDQSDSPKLIESSPSNTSKDIKPSPDKSSPIKSRLQIGDKPDTTSSPIPDDSKSSPSPDDKKDSPISTSASVPSRKKSNATIRPDITRVGDKPDITNPPIPDDKEDSSISTSEPTPSNVPIRLVGDKPDTTSSPIPDDSKSSPIPDDKKDSSMSTSASVPSRKKSNATIRPDITRVGDKPDITNSPIPDDKEDSSISTSEPTPSNVPIRLVGDKPDTTSSPIPDDTKSSPIPDDTKSSPIPDDKKDSSMSTSASVPSRKKSNATIRPDITRVGDKPDITNSPIPDDKEDSSISTSEPTPSNVPIRLVGDKPDTTSSPIPDDTKSSPIPDDKKDSSMSTSIKSDINDDSDDQNGANSESSITSDKENQLDKVDSLKDDSIGSLDYKSDLSNDDTSIILQRFKRYITKSSPVLPSLKLLISTRDLIATWKVWDADFLHQSNITKARIERLPGMKDVANELNNVEDLYKNYHIVYEYTSRLYNPVYENIIQPLHEISNYVINQESPQNIFYILQTIEKINSNLLYTDTDYNDVSQIQRFAISLKKSRDDFVTIEFTNDLDKYILDFEKAVESMNGSRIPTKYGDLGLDSCPDACTQLSLLNTAMSDKYSILDTLYDYVKHIGSKQIIFESRIDDLFVDAASKSLRGKDENGMSLYGSKSFSPVDTRIIEDFMKNLAGLMNEYELSQLIQTDLILSRIYKYIKLEPSTLLWLQFIDLYDNVDKLHQDLIDVQISIICKEIRDEVAKEEAIVKGIVYLYTNELFPASLFASDPFGDRVFEFSQYLSHLYDSAENVKSILGSVETFNQKQHGVKEIKLIMALSSQEVINASKTLSDLNEKIKYVSNFNNSRSLSVIDIVIDNLTSQLKLEINELTTVQYDEKSFLDLQKYVMKLIDTIREKPLRITEAIYLHNCIDMQLLNLDKSYKLIPMSDILFNTRLVTNGSIRNTIQNIFVLRPRQETYPIQRNEKDIIPKLVNIEPSAPPLPSAEPSAPPLPSAEPSAPPLPSDEPSAPPLPSPIESTSDPSSDSTKDIIEDGKQKTPIINYVTTGGNDIDEVCMKRRKATYFGAFSYKYDNLFTTTLNKTIEKFSLKERVMANELLESTQSSIDKIINVINQNNNNIESIPEGEIEKKTLKLLKNLVTTIGTSIDRYYIRHKNFVSNNVKQEGIIYIDRWKDKEGVKDVQKNIDSVMRGVSDFASRMTTLAVKSQTVIDSALTDPSKVESIKRMLDERITELDKTVSKIKFLYSNRQNLIEMIMDISFLMLYVVKILRVVFIWAALYISSKLFEQMYMKQVYTQNKEPPNLMIMLGIFLLIDLAMNAFLVVVLFLVMYLFKTPVNMFVVDETFIKKYLVDYFAHGIICAIIALIMASIVQKKRYFKYKLEGPRAIRAYQEVIMGMSSILMFIPFFMIG